MTDYFITATDTDAGKTYVAAALVHALVTQGQKVAVYKPISAGCDRVKNSLVNNDALLLMQVANSAQSIENINPIAFEQAIAPHIAAQIVNKPICISDIQTGFKKVKLVNPDITVTEGAGGWRLPLGNGVFLSDFVKSTEQKVILVVNMKLGCLNHAVLTYQAIINDGLECVAWVANCPSNMPYLAQNIAELERLLPIARIAHLGFEPDVEKAAKMFDLSLLP